MNETDLIIGKPIEYEPKREGLFYVVFPEEMGIQSWMVLSCDKPKWINGEWGNMNIVLNDNIGPSSSQLLMNNVLKYLIPLHKSIKNGNTFQLFQYDIYALDPVGIEVENWSVKVQNVDIDFGYFNYDSNNKATISMLIKPLYCELKY